MVSMSSPSAIKIEGECALSCAGEEGDRPAPSFGLWRLNAQSTLCLFDATLSAERGAVKVNLGPLEGKQFAASSASGEREAHDWMQ